MSFVSGEKGPGGCFAVERKRSGEITTAKPAYWCAPAVLLSFYIAAACASVPAGAGRQSTAGAEVDAAERRQSPYAAYQELRGDLHVHSSTGSFDAKSCQGACRVFSAAEQLSEARSAGLDYAAITEHDLNPNEPNSRMSKEEWERVLTAVSRANTEGFVALAGYEWTSSHRSCFLAAPQTDYNHKIVILPPETKTVCDSLTCANPDDLATFVHRNGGVIITAHPWRVLLLDGAGNTKSHVSRNYFTYKADGPGGVIVGAEVGPDFQPFEWPGLLCDRPSESYRSRTVTIEEWVDALQSGKRLAAIASSDRHDSRIPFGTRTTTVFVKEKTPEGVIEGLHARRTHAAHLAPFQLRFSVDHRVVGSAVTNAKEALIELITKPEGFDTLEIWLGKTMIRRFDALPPGGRVVISLQEVGRGPLWVKVTGKEIDGATQTPRMTITSPIWLQ